MFSPLLFHLSFYRRSETFAKKSNNVGFVQSSLFIKFLENGLEIFKVRDLVFYLFLLKLRVTFDSAPGRVDESSGITKIFLKKSLEIDPGYGFYLTPIFMLVPAETDPSTKKRDSK